MIVAVWRCSADALPEGLAARLNRLFQEPGAVRVDQAATMLALWSPALLQRRGSRVVAWAVSGGGEHVPPGLPSVELEAETLTLAAPQVPQFPLYYLRSADDKYLIASSRLEPLARMLPNAPLSEQRLVSIVVGAVDPDRGATIYDGIRRLLPSETVTASPRGVRAERTLPRIGRTYRRGRAEDLAIELRYRLDASIGRIIGPCKRVAVLTSGGLDSSGILAIAATQSKANGRKVHALTLEARTPGDDRPYFAELVRALAVPDVRLHASDAAAWFRPSLVADGQPGAGPGLCLDMLFYTTASKLGAEVALTGSAGDTVLGGPLPFAQLAWRGHVVAALNGALRIRVPWSMSRWARVRTFVLGQLAPRTVVRVRRRRADRAPWMTSRFRAILERCRKGAERRARPLPDTPDDWMEEWCEGDDCVLPTIADGAGQALAATSGAVFDPFMDFDFLRFMFEIDPALLSYGHEYRGLYRLAMKGALPERIRTRQDKAGYESVFAAAALAANALDLLRDLSSLDALASRSLVEPRAFRATFERWMSAVRQGERDYLCPGDECWSKAWPLLSVEAFLRKHGGGRSLV